MSCTQECHATSGREMLNKRLLLTLSLEWSLVSNEFVKQIVQQIFYRLTRAKQINGIIMAVWGYIVNKLCSLYRGNTWLTSPIGVFQRKEEWKGMVH